MDGKGHGRKWESWSRGNHNQDVLCKKKYLFLLKGNMQEVSYSSIYDSR